MDLRCCRGVQLERLFQTLGAANLYCGVEVSKPMLKASRRHLKGWIDCGLAEVRDVDLRRDFPPLPSSVTLSILTIQFTPIEYLRKDDVQRWLTSTTGKKTRALARAYRTSGAASLGR